MKQLVHTFLNISSRNRKAMFYLQCTNTRCLKITGHRKFRTKYRRSSGIPANPLHTPWTSPLLYSSGALYVAKILRIRGNFRSNDTGKSGFEKFSGVCPRVTAFNFELRPGKGIKKTATLLWSNRWLHYTEIDHRASVNIFFDQFSKLIN